MTSINRCLCFIHIRSAVTEYDRFNKYILDFFQCFSTALCDYFTIANISYSDRQLYKTIILITERKGSPVTVRGETNVSCQVISLGKHETVFL